MHDFIAPDSESPDPWPYMPSTKLHLYLWSIVPCVGCTFRWWCLLICILDVYVVGELGDDF